MYEIMLMGSEPSIARQIHLHIQKTLADSEPFDLKRWYNRPRVNKLFEWLLLSFRHLL